MSILLGVGGVKDLFVIFLQQTGRYPTREIMPIDISPTPPVGAPSLTLTHPPLRGIPVVGMGGMLVAWVVLCWVACVASQPLAVDSCVSYGDISRQV